MIQRESRKARDLDARVHREVMGRTCERREVDLISPTWEDWCEESEQFLMGGRGAWRPIPRYSTDIAAAWLVVEKLIQFGFNPSVDWYKDIGDWIVTIDRFHEEENGDESTRFVANEQAGNAPLGICLASLKAVSATAKAT